MRLLALAILAGVALPSAARAQDAPADVPAAADEPAREAPQEELARVDPRAIAPEAPVAAERSEIVPDPQPWPAAEEPPAYATWWLWTAIGIVALGITAAIVVALTTDAPVSSIRSPLAVGF